ncbi:flagellar basal body-associated FliL family protein [Brevibacterium atlanticum]|uniref:hypothetical protein n=1 Tax=Brevibacterium atlanticum TaxID=2697563 RepID=UPI001D18BA0C|nr:hypothetical protein [Brevibacterium atlanticum]
MSANPPGRGDENEWDVNDRSGSQWSSQPTPQSNSGWGTPQPGQQPPHQQSGPAQPQSRPYVQAPQAQGQPPYSQTGPQFQQGPPPYQQQASPAPKKRGGLIALFAVIVIVLGVGIGWGAAQMFPRDSDDKAAVKSTDDPTNEQTDAGDESAAASEDPEPTETESKLPDDPKKALKQLAATDGKAVTDDLDGKWVPQLSSKKVGLEAEGKTWKEQDILDEHEELREEYPRVRLVWSGDFSSFRESNFWVTVVGIGYSDPEDALSWCSSHGLGPDSCYAKQLNTSGGDEGTTRLQD